MIFQHILPKRNNSDASEKTMSSLPVHSLSPGGRTDTVETARTVDDPILQGWKSRHREADANLHKLEKELDVLLDCARILREKRTDLTQSADSSSTEFITEDGPKLIDEYLLLANKSRALDESIKELKEECATNRSECNYCITKIRHLSPRSSRPSRKLKQLHHRDSLPFGGAECGFTDPTALAQRIIDAERTATSSGAVVGVFGAGIAYTTLFSATRGRLDLIAWAFTCFTLVMISCVAFQLFALPRHGEITRILRMEYIGSAEQRLLVYLVLVGLPMVSGFILLALSVAFLDPHDHNATSGSKESVQAAGYLPIGFLGYFVILMIIVMLVSLVIRLLSWHNVLQWPLDHLPPEARKDYPSILFSIKDRLFFLPGGQGYSLYREKRLQRSETEGRTAT